MSRAMCPECFARRASEEKKTRMTTNKKRRAADAESLWKSQSIQFVWFPKEVNGSMAESLFLTITGSEPDTVLTSKAVSQRNPILGQAHGQSDTLRTVVEVRPGRIDLHLLPAESFDGEDDGADDLPTAETIDSVLSALSDRVSEIIGPVTRLSIALKSREERDNYEQAANDGIQAFGMNFGLTNFTDFQAQINKRLRVDGMPELNRLVRFSVESLQKLSLEVGRANESRVIPIEQERIYSAMLLDFNTVVDGAEIDARKCREIFSFIAEEAIRFAAIRKVDALSP